MDRVRLVCIQHLYYRVPGVVQLELLRFEDVGLVCLDTPYKFRTARFPAMVSDSLERTPTAPEFKMGTSGSERSHMARRPCGLSYVVVLVLEKTVEYTTLDMWATEGIAVGFHQAYYKTVGCNEES